MKRLTNTLRLPIEQNNKLTEISKKVGISKNALILQIIWEYLRKLEKEVNTRE
jgi:predicted DNA-binding protein